MCLYPKYTLTHCIVLAGTVNMLWTKKYSESKHGFTHQNNCPTTKKCSIDGLDDVSKRVNYITENTHIYIYLTKSSLIETNRLQQWKPSFSFPEGSHLGIPVRCSRAHRSFIQIYASINNNVIVPRGYPRGFSWRLLAAICRSCIRSVPRRLGERHDAVYREIPQNLLQPTADRFVAPIFHLSVSAVCSSYGWRRKMIQTPGAVQTSQLIPRQAIG